MSPDDIFFLLREMEILICFPHCDLGMGSAVLIGGQSLLLDVVLIVVMKHRAARELPLIDIPPEFFCQGKTSLSDSDAVLQCVAAVMLGKRTELYDPGIFQELIQFIDKYCLIICHRDLYLSF